MLQKLNERIQGVVAWVVVSVIALTFALFGIDSYIQARHTSLVEAEVNGKPISKQALELRYRRVRHELDMSAKTTGTEKQLKEQILDKMIASKINMNAALHYGFFLNDEQVKASILQVPQLQQDGQFSPERYEQVLSAALFTPQSFQQEIYRGMLLNQQHFAFLGTAFALPNEVENFVKLYGQTRDYRYLQIPTSTFLKDVSVSNNEVKAYYASHTDDFIAPEQVSLEFVTLSMAAVRAKLNPSETELKTYYENNQASYMAPAKWQVRHILFEIPTDVSDANLQAIKTRVDALYHQVNAAPDTFVAESKHILDTKQKNIKAGVLPWIVAGKSPLDADLLQLTTVGQLLPPLKTEAGYELFQLQAYVPAQVKTFDAVHATVREHWLAERAQADYARLQEELSDNSYQMPDSLTPVAEALKLPIEKTVPFSHDGGKELMTSSPRILKAAFSHDVLVLGNNSAPIQLDDDRIVVVRVKKHIAERKKALSEVQSQIKEILMHNKAQARAEALGHSLQSNKQGAFMDEAMLLKHHLIWNIATQATRDSSIAPAEINDLAFTISRAGSRGGQVLSNHAGYVVVELNEVNHGTLSMLDNEQKQSISQQLAANYGTVDYDLYTSNLLEQAHVVKH
ncbi:MAG: SurA N-terminal domain-containing protein [Legionellaceae bacterium]|nr:SurA N-terminal domain-containing protein [Legionellaceae bacterium]